MIEYSWEYSWVVLYNLMETPHPGWMIIIQPGGIPPPWPHDIDVRIVLLVLLYSHTSICIRTTSRSSMIEYDPTPSWCFGVILHYIITTNRLRIFSWWGPSHHWSFWKDSGLAPQYLGGPPLGEVCLDHCPQGDRVVDDQEDAIMEQTNPVILLMTSFSFDRRVTE